MQLAIFITARIGSTRLANKHLLLVNQKPIITYLINRIHKEFYTELITENLLVAIVTGNKQLNQSFEHLEPKVRVFYGDDENIPARHSQAAKYFGVDGIVSIDGDDILCATSAMRKVYTGLVDGAELIKTEGMPFGMNAWGYSTNLLEQSVQKSQYTLLETGWGRIFDQSKMQIISFSGISADKRLRFSLDYAQDFLFFKEIITGLGEKITDVSDHELIEYVLDQKIYRKNQEITREYWKNFREHQKNEEGRKKNGQEPQS